jgi:hypothetical protein
MMRLTEKPIGRKIKDKKNYFNQTKRIMKAQELRIGNLLYNDNVVVTIDARTIFDIWDDAGLKKYNPIPLTEEWLYKTNHILDTTNNWFYKLQMYEEYMIRKCGNGWLLFLDGVSENKFSVEVFYLHQLQNLYYALTGEELL